MSFYSRYEELCKEQGLSPQSKEIMNALKVTSGTITGWSKGSKPNYDSIIKISEFFGVDVRYILELSDSKRNEDIIEAMTDKLIDGGVDVHSYDNDNGVGQEYILTYNGKSFNYQAHEYENLCKQLDVLLNNTELFAIDKFCREHFGGKVVTSNAELTQQEWKLILNYRSLNDDGKIIIQAAMIKELRKMEE